MKKRRHAPSQNYYQVGLGEDMLFRSRIIFLGLSATVVVIIAYAFITAVQSGAIQRNIIEPTKYFVSAMMKDATASAKPRTINTITIYNATSSATVRVNTQDSSPTTTNTRVKTYTSPNPQPTQYQYTNNANSYDSAAAIKAQNDAAQKAWEDALKKQQEWSNQKKAENQKWFDTQSAKNAASTKSWYDEQVQKMQQDTEAWKKAHGF